MRTRHLLLLVLALMLACAPAGAAVDAPLVSAAETIAARSNWPPEGAIAVTRVAEAPSVAVARFASLDIQARALDRVAAMIEKSHDGVVSDGASFVGHDYESHTLARFFDWTSVDAIPLDEHELAILDLALMLDMIRWDGAHFVATWPPQALITFAEDDPNSMSTLRHELSHGEFFTNPAYRAWCEMFWESLTPDERAVLTRELAAMGYDRDNDVLMVNETQAYLWDDGGLGEAFDRGLREIGSSLADLRARFLAGAFQISL
ncbi:MAG: hypothetical protein HQL40_09135 [Alphaproteobacteria bacterium]|nr:hypothetical protein [Alphaproteobacteria bacterium]